MKLIIDIPEVFYEALRKTDEIISGQRSGKTLMSVICNAVANGTPLPKGHGDIVDIETLIDMFWDGNSMEITKYDLSVIEPIIEADKAESGDKCKNCEYYHNPDYTRCHECKAERSE